jgi:ketosteroid isomerase-like protein
MKSIERGQRYSEVPRLLAAVAVAARSAERDTARTMSEENVETVRRFFDLLNRGAFDELDAITPAGFELDRSRSRSLKNRIYRADEIRGIWKDLGEAWADYDFFETEMIDAGDIVVRVGGAHARGRSSRIEVQADSATVWRFRDGTPVAAALFQTKAEALEAAGLSE